MNLSNETSLLYDYLIHTLANENDFVSYDDVLANTGLEVRAGISQKGYQVLVRVRVLCEQGNRPFMLECVRGAGLKRLRIGHCHLKSNDRLQANRRNSRRAIELNNAGLPHATNDSESFMIMTQNRIHSRSLATTNHDALASAYSNISNGALPPRTNLMSLRELLRSSKEDAGL